MSRHPSSSSLNLSRYFRLMALAATDITLSVPFSLFFLSVNLKRGLKPWVSWDYVHWGFSQTPQVPIFAIKEMGDWPALEINRWSSPICAIIFFCFFGLAGESLAAYKRFFERFVTKPLQPLFTSMPWRQGDRHFDGGVTLPSTPGAATSSSPGWHQTKSRFTEPPTPVSALKSSRPLLSFSGAGKERSRQSDIESGLDYYFADEKTLTSASSAVEGTTTFVPPSVGRPPRALSTASPSLRRELSHHNEDKDLPEPPSPAVFDIRRFSTSASFVNDTDIKGGFALAPPVRDDRDGDNSRASSALPSASDSAAFPLDLSSFPIPASLPCSYQSPSSLLHSHSSLSPLQGVPSSFESSHSYASFAFPPSFPFASSSLLTATSLNGQFRNSLPLRYSFAPATAFTPAPGTGMSASAFPLVHTAAGMGMSSPAVPGHGHVYGGLRFSEVYRHSYAGPASPRHDEHQHQHQRQHQYVDEHGYAVGEEPENCYDVFPPTPMAL